MKSRTRTDDFLSLLYSQFSIPFQVRRNADYIRLKVKLSGNAQTRAAAIIVAAYKLIGLPAYHLLYQFKKSGMSLQKINRQVLVILQTLRPAERTTKQMQTITSYNHAAEMLNVPLPIRTKTIHEILSYNPALISSPIVASAFFLYYSSNHCGFRVTKEAVSEATSVTEVSIRNFYNRTVEHLAKLILKSQSIPVPPRIYLRKLKTRSVSVLDAVISSAITIAKANNRVLTRELIETNPPDELKPFISGKEEVLNTHVKEVNRGKDMTWTCPICGSHEVEWRDGRAYCKNCGYELTDSEMWEHGFVDVAAHLSPEKEKEWTEQSIKRKSAGGVEVKISDLKRWERNNGSAKI